MARVTLEGLEKRFGAEKVIDHVDLDVDEGEFLTLLGPSGCGKTTTLRIIAGFLSPDSGKVLFGNKDITNIPTQKRKLGMVFQDYALFPHLNVADNVGFALRSIGMPKADISRRVKELLDLVRLPGMAERIPAQLSGGQQQRIAIARALAHTPTVLLMDEPLGALDLKLREAMQDELHRIQRQLGITTIYVTHDQEEALSLSHRIALMRDGKIEQLDRPKAIYAEPRTPFCAFFLGKVNFLQGEVTNCIDGTYLVSVSGTQLRCPVRSQQKAFKPGEQVLLGVRPEHLRLTDVAPSASLNALRGRTAREKFTGKVTQVDVEAGDDNTRLVVDSTSARTAGVGSNVDVVWEPTFTHIYPFKEDAECGIIASSRAQRSGRPIVVSTEPAMPLDSHKLITA